MVLSPCVLVDPLWMIYLLLWNVPLHCVTRCCWDWFNKEADLSTVGQDKVRQDSQTRRKVGEGRVESGVASQRENE